MKNGSKNIFVVLIGNDPAPLTLEGLGLGQQPRTSLERSPKRRSLAYREAVLPFRDGKEEHAPRHVTDSTAPPIPELPKFSQSIAPSLGLTLPYS